MKRLTILHVAAFFFLMALPVRSEPGSGARKFASTPKLETVKPEETSQAVEEAKPPEVEKVKLEIEETSSHPKLEKVFNNQAPASSEVAVVLYQNRFLPQTIRLSAGKDARIFFVSVNSEPAALIIEKLNIQRWVASEQEQKENHSVSSFSQINRELSSGSVAEVRIEPDLGTYHFHDALSGAQGNIIVE